jgi:hypothetical protein
MYRLLSFVLFLFSCFAVNAVLTTPTQQQPSDNTTGLGSSVNIYLTGSSGTEVVIEYAETSAMSNSLRIITPRTSSSVFVYIPKLKLGTSYFWRVKSRSSTDSSNWSSIRKFTTDANFLSLYPTTDILNLVGSEVHLSTYTVFGYDSILFQIDTSSSFNSNELRNTVKTDTGNIYYVTTTEKNFRYGVTYYWRARAYNATQNTNWTNVLLFSFNDSIELKYPSMAYLQPVSITFEWTSGSNSEPFQVQINTISSFNDPLIDTIASDGTRRFYPNPFTIPNLNYETTYYYRVRTFNTADTTRWSYSSFKTDGFGTSDIVTIDNWPDPTTTLKARRVIVGSLANEIQLSTASDFNTAGLQVLKYTGADTTAYDLLFGQSYYVRARPYHAKDTGNWGRTRTVTVTKYPNSYYPFNNATNVGLTDSLVLADMDGVQAYQIQVAVNGDYTNQLFLDTTLIDMGQSNYQIVKGLLYRFNTTYQWRMRAWHAKDTSDWSINQKFNTIVSPTLQLPFNSAILGTDANVNLEWQAMKGTTGYHVMLDTSASFTSPKLIDTVITENSLTQENLLFRPLYYWKVRLFTSTDTSAWSDTWKFKVLSPRLNYPSNNIKNLTLTSLDWNSIKGTKGYILEVDSLADFSKPLEYTDTVQNSFFHYFTVQPDYIEFNKKYYWRVKLFHSKDTSDWSIAWNFTTKARQAPTLVSPADSSQNISVFSTLKWAAYSGAASYAIELSENANFIGATKLTSTTTSVAVMLKAKTRYYWHVRGRNSAGQEFYDYSVTWTFTSNGGITAPILISPANAAINQPKTVVLRWNKDDNATNYRVELSNDSNFLGVYANTVAVASTTFSEIVEGTTYFWRVRTVAGSYTSPWSEKRKFTTFKTNTISSIESDKFRCYPNPASSSLTVVSNSRSIDLLRITDNLGQEITSFYPRAAHYVIDVSQLTPGTYTLHVCCEADWTRQLFVVNP